MSTVASMNTAAAHGALRDSRFVRDRKPRTLRVLALIVALPLFFSVGRYIPAFKWTLELGIALSLVLAVLSTVGAKARTRNPFNIYLMLVAFGVPVLGALSAYIVFGQPMWLGLAAQRGCLLALFAYAMGNFLDNERLTLAEFQRALVILAWLNLAICAPVLIFLDPNDFSGLGGLVSDGGGVFNEFHLPMMFIVFGAIYFVSNWMLSGRAVYGLLAAPFLLYIFGGNTGRVLNLAMVVALVVIAWIGSPHRRFGNILGAIALTAVILVVVETVIPGKIGAMLSRYGDAFSAVSGAYNVEDISANARILQAETAWPYVLNNPIIGTGAISNEWNGGYKAMFGYFHPSDLGLLGLVFVYGLVGVIFFGVQYVFLLRSISPVAKLVGRVPHSALLLAMAALLVFLLVSSVSTGLFVLVPEQALLFFVLMRAQIQRYSYAN